jgi:hypothetical protein
MKRFLKRLFGGNQAGAARARKRRAVPLAVESLEPRYALSTLTPIEVRQYYGFDQVGFQNATHPILQIGDGQNTKIAIVDLYNDPNIRGDLATFDANYQIPAPPSFTIVNQNGQTDQLPANNTRWSGEIALDVEYAHAMAPGANILLVEANNYDPTNMDTATRYAASQPGVVVVSMSYGHYEEFAGNETNRDPTFTQPGVTYVAGSGDTGAPAMYPAFSPNVVAVGGTTLDLSMATGYSERGWSSSGGGISQFESQPAYQVGVVPDSMSTDANGIKRRTSPDAAFIADSVWVYDTFGHIGFYSESGTSLSTPIMAGLVSIVDQGRAYLNNQAPYSSVDFLTDLYRLPSSAFYDITTGTSTGNPNYSAGPGYDLVTGRGTPIVPLFVADLTGSTPQTHLVSDKNNNVFSLNPAYGEVYERGADLVWRDVGSGISSLVGDAAGYVFALNPSSVPAGGGPAGIVYEYNLGGPPGSWSQSLFGISSLVRDQTGNVFALNPSSGFVYEHDLKTVLGWTPVAGWQSPGGTGGISSLVSDATGNVFALSRSGLVYEHGGGAVWIPSFVGSSLVRDATGNVFALVGGSVSEHVLGADPSNWNSNVRPEFDAASMGVDNTGALYILSTADHGVYRYDTASNSWGPNLRPADDAATMVVDNTGGLYVLSATDHGVYRYDASINRWVPVYSGVASISLDITGALMVTYL